MKAPISTVFYHAGGKWFGGARADAGWYASNGDWTIPVTLAIPGLTGGSPRKLLTVGELAMAHHRAANDVNSAKHRYHDAIRKYEKVHGSVNGRIDPSNQDHLGLVAATTNKYLAYLDAKRIAYNIKRRLDNACRKAVSQ